MEDILIVSLLILFLSLIEVFVDKYRKNIHWISWVQRIFIVGLVSFLAGPLYSVEIRTIYALFLFVLLYGAIYGVVFGKSFYNHLNFKGMGLPVNTKHIFFYFLVVTLFLLTINILTYVKHTG